MGRRSRLIKALEYEDDERVKFLLRHRNANLNARDKTSGATSLHWAIKRGSQEIIRILLDKKARVNALSYDYKTPLHWAIEQGNLEGAATLLEYGANTDKIDEYGATPLHSAVLKGDVKATRLLVEYGADANAKHKYGNTPFQIAVQDGNQEIIKILLEKGANVNDFDKYGRCPIHSAIEGSPENANLELHGALGYFKFRENYDLLFHASNYKIAALLIEYGADVDAKDKHARTPLDQALRSNNKEIVEILLRKNANFDALDQSGRSKLHHAVEYCGTDIVELLLQYKANVNAIDNEGRSPFAVAVRRNRPDITKLLIEYGANTNPAREDKVIPLYIDIGDDPAYVNALLDEGADIHTRRYGRTPLHQAVECRYEEIVEILLDRKADVDATDSQGATALHQAVINTRGKGRLEMVRILLDKKANVDAMDKSGRTPLCLAIEGWGVLECAEALLKYRADANVRDLYGYTPLHSAVRVRDMKAIKLLLEYGADINIASDYGLTPLGYCLWFRRGEYLAHKIIQELIFHMVELKVAGLFLCDEYYQALSRTKDPSDELFIDELVSHELECNLELTRMKSRLKTNILTTESPRYVLNNTLAQQLESFDYSDFPIYGKMVKRKYARDKLLEASREPLRELVEADRKHMAMPSELLEKILRHLSDRDLLNLISSAGQDWDSFIEPIAKQPRIQEAYFGLFS